MYIIASCPSSCLGKSSTAPMSQEYIPEEAIRPMSRRQRGFHPLGLDRIHDDPFTPQPEVANLHSRKGNNRYGAAGTLKCRRCRSRKTKVQRGDFTSDSSVISRPQTPTNLARIVWSKMKHCPAGQRSRHNNSRL